MTSPLPDGTCGDRLGRYFELPAAPALVMLPASSGPFAVTRITCTPDQLGTKQEIPAEDAFVVTLHLVGMRHPELWVRGCSRGAISTPICATRSPTTSAVRWTHSISMHRRLAPWHPHPTDMPSTVWPCRGPHGAGGNRIETP